VRAEQQLELAAIEVDAAATAAALDRDLLDLLLRHVAAALRALHPVRMSRRLLLLLRPRGVELAAPLRDHLLLELVEVLLLAVVARVLQLFAHRGALRADRARPVRA
jgi:hypothetical protein